jgi:surfactin synthase thioesterase subunit
MSVPSTVVQADRIVVRPDPGAAVKLLVFHHAGGSAAAMLQLARQLPVGVETTAFELPGRGVRTRDKPADTFAAARDELLGKVRAGLDRPTVIFGHSLGAMLADSVARRLSAGERRLVRRVILSGCPAPRGKTVRPSTMRERSRESLKSQLVDFGGTPAEVLATPGLLDYFAEVLGFDMRLVDTSVLEAEPDPPALDYELWYGKADDTDGLGTPEYWREILPGPPVVRYFEGGHFYLFDESGAAARGLRDVVTAVQADRY